MNLRARCSENRKSIEWFSHPPAAVTYPSTKVMAEISPPTAMEAELQPPDGRCRGVYCANPDCGKIMSLEGTWPLQATEEGQITWRPVAQPVICPHCKTEATYPLARVRTFPARRNET